MNKRELGREIRFVLIKGSIAHPEQFQNDVNSLLADGWKLHGTVFTYWEDGIGQAMVREIGLTTNSTAG